MTILHRFRFEKEQGRILILAAMLVLMILQTGRTGIAELYAMQVQKILDGPNVADQIEAAAGRMRFAIQLDGKNPAYFEYVARLQIMESESSPPERERHLENALQAIRRAVALRPTSPYSWSLLLYVKSQLGEVDGEFAHALSAAVFLGPWEPEVQRVVANIGLKNWRKLSFQQREEVRKNIVRGMVRQPEAMSAIMLAQRCARSNCR